jgi:hypothetical protein
MILDIQEPQRLELWLGLVGLGCCIFWGGLSIFFWSTGVLFCFVPPSYMVCVCASLSLLVMVKEG